jgi:hypothetical protein
MLGRNISHLAINPIDSIEPGLVKKASDILKKDAYEMRLLLSGKIPKIIAHFGSEIECRQTVAALLAVGIRAFVVDDVELWSHPIKQFSAHNLVTSDRQVTFISRSGAQEIVRFADVYMIIYGKVQRTILLEETKSSIKFNLPATLLTGGIPVWRKSRENVEKKSTQSEYFVKLYKQESSEPVVEISELNFDFSFLGNRVSPSSSKNIQELIIELKRLFAGALFDNRLAEYAPAIEESEIKSTCKLIYLSYRAQARAQEYK